MLLSSWMKTASKNTDPLHSSSCSTTSGRTKSNRDKARTWATPAEKKGVTEFRHSEAHDIISDSTQVKKFCLFKLSGGSVPADASCRPAYRTSLAGVSVSPQPVTNIPVVTAKSSSTASDAADILVDDPVCLVIVRLSCCYPLPRVVVYLFIPEKQITPGFSTIERWFYQAKDTADPIAALGRKIRVDAGIRRVASEELKAAIQLQYDAGKHWSVQLHYDNLLAQALNDAMFPHVPSYKSVLRCMRENGWEKKNGPSHPTGGQIQAELRRERREIRSYEASHVHALWHLDFHHAKIRLLDASGAWYQPMALAIIDDRSRVCCHLQFYMSETAECLIHGLTRAIMKRGLPRALMTDNGAAMVAEETRQGLARLGIVHETTLPYSPYQNGKQEVFRGQLEGRLIALLKGLDDLDLAFLNKAAQACRKDTVDREDFICITDIAKYKNSDDPRFVIQNWMKTRATVEFTRCILRILPVPCGSISTLRMPPKNALPSSLKYNRKRVCSD